VSLVVGLFLNFVGVPHLRNDLFCFSEFFISFFFCPILDLLNLTFKLTNSISQLVFDSQFIPFFFTFKCLAGFFLVIKLNLQQLKSIVMFNSHFCFFKFKQTCLIFELCIAADQIIDIHFHLLLLVFIFFPERFHVDVVSLSDLLEPVSDCLFSSFTKLSFEILSLSLLIINEELILFL